MKFPSVALIGAGVSGLSCARFLLASGLNVTVLEKSRSLGGRCATRRWEGHIVDHGAQYFTIRDQEFRREINFLLADELREISMPVVDESGALIGDEPRWYLAQGNNRLGKVLAMPLDIRLETTVPPPELRDGRWHVAGAIYDALISSTPWPQTLALLGHESTDAAFAPCLTAILSYRGLFAGNSFQCYGRMDMTDPLSWSACENHKIARIANDQTVFVAHASAEFSTKHFETKPDLWRSDLQQKLEQKWELQSADRLATFTHRWKFARYLGKALLNLDQLPDGFFVTGDVRTESRVESAWIAGRTTAREVLAYFNIAES